MRIEQNQIIRKAFALTVLVLLAPLAFAKRGAPAEVKPTVHEGIEYRAPGSIPTKIGVVEAWDKATGKMSWEKKVYTVEIKPDLEEDVQHVYIKELEIDAGKLIVTTERDDRYAIDLKTQEVARLDAALAPPDAAVEEDVAFFEKKYQKKITGVKPKGEYPDPDEFYSAIGQQLGIPEIAWKAAAAKFGWKKDDGKQTFTILKGGPTANGGQGTWDVMFMRCMINPDTKKPDPATLQQVMVQIDYDGNIKFPEVPQGKK